MSLRSTPLRWFFRLAFLITWGAGAASLVLTRGDSGALHPGSVWVLVAGCGPTIAALLCTQRLDGWSGVASLLARVRPTWRSLAWYPALLVGYPLLVLMVHMLVRPELASGLGLERFFAKALPAYALLMITRDTGPVGEELGWRGFALPRLLVRWSPATASLILGVVWTLWHAPTFFLSGLPQHTMSIPAFALNTIALSVLLVALYQRVAGRLDVMILGHGMANLLAGLVPLEMLAAVHASGAVLVLLARHWTRAVVTHD